MKKQAPTNTAERVQRDPLAIEHQEATGQRELVNSDTLPTDMRPEYKSALEAAGVKFAGPVEGDSMFQYAELPAGWKKQRTDHSMWSELRDEKGRKRASIFYKASSYDRSAHLSCERRYSVRTDYDLKDKAGVAVSRVHDGDTVIYSTEPLKIEGKDYWTFTEQADKLAETWLAEHFPDWKDCSKYWTVTADAAEEKQMTITYCDLCGKALDRGDTGTRIAISEYKAEGCDECAKRLINFVKTGPWKGGQK